MSSYLKITVIEAKNLASSKKLYCQVTILNSNGQKVGKDVKTPVIKGTNNPAWGTPFQFTVDEEFAGIVVRTYEKSTLGFADRFIGIVTIRLTTERVKYKKLDKWYPLAKQSANQNVTGELRLEIDFRDPDLGDVKKRKKMSDRSISISGDVSPPEAKLQVDIIARGSTNPRSPSPTNTSSGDRSPSASLQIDKVSSPQKKVSPVFARKTSFERRNNASLGDRRAARQSVAVSKFQLDSYIKQAEDAAQQSSESERKKEEEESDSDNEIGPIRIGAFSVAQRGGQRRGRRDSDDVDEGYATTSAVPSRTGIKSPIIDPKRAPRSPQVHSGSAASSPGKLPDEEDPKSKSKARSKLKRVSTLDVDMENTRKAHLTPVKAASPPPEPRYTNSAPTRVNQLKPTRQPQSPSVSIGYSTDSPSSSPLKARGKKSKTMKISPTEEPPVPEPAVAETDVSPRSEEDGFGTPTRAKKGRRRQQQEAETEVPRSPRDGIMATPIVAPIVPILPRSYSPNRNRQNPDVSAVGAPRPASPQKRSFPESPVLGPLVVERRKAEDRSKRLSMQLGYATDAPPSRPRNSSKSSSRHGSRGTEDASQPSETTGTPKKKKKTSISEPVAEAEAQPSPAAIPETPVEVATEPPTSARKKKKRKSHADGEEAAAFEAPATATAPAEVAAQPSVSTETKVDEPKSAAPSPALEQPAPVEAKIEEPKPVEPAKEPEPTSTELLAVVAPVEPSPVAPVESALEPKPADGTPAVVTVVAPVELPSQEEPKQDAPANAEPAREPEPEQPAESLAAPAQAEIKSTEPVAAPAPEKQPTEEHTAQPVSNPPSRSGSAEYIAISRKSQGPLRSGSNDRIENGRMSPSTSQSTIPVRVGEPTSPSVSPASSATHIPSDQSQQQSRMRLDRTSSIVENAASGPSRAGSGLARATSIKEVLSTDDPAAKSQLMKNFFSGLGMTKKKNN